MGIVTLELFDRGSEQTLLSPQLTQDTNSDQQLSDLLRIDQRASRRGARVLIRPRPIHLSRVLALTPSIRAAVAFGMPFAAARRRA